MDDVINDLAKAMRFNADGYELARELHSRYFPNTELVDILDGADWEIRKVLSKAEKEWVIASGASPIPLETRVRWSKYPDHDGIITANHDDGKATVMYEHLGHVREGIGSHGYIVEWELLTPSIHLEKVQV